MLGTTLLRELFLYMPKPAGLNRSINNLWVKAFNGTTFPWFVCSVVACAKTLARIDDNAAWSTVNGSACGSTYFDYISAK